MVPYVIVQQQQHMCSLHLVYHNIRVPPYTECQQLSL